MRKYLIRDSSIGFVLFVATLIVMAGLFLVGDGPGILAVQSEYRVLLDHAGGLRSGSRVYLSGVPVGNVAQIDFSPDLKGDKILVTLRINRQYADRIGESSKAWLQNEGLLGDAAMHLSLRGQSSELAPGSEIPYEPRGVLDEIAGVGTTATTADLLKTTMDILKDFQRGKGSLGQLLKNPELYDNLNAFTATMKSATEEVEKVSKEVELLLAAVRSQKGTLGKLIFSEEYARDFEQSLKHTDALIARVDRIVAKVESGSGSLGKLLSDEEFYEGMTKALERLSLVAGSTDEVMRGLSKSDSVIGRLLNEEELGDSFATLLARLARSSGALQTILEKVERGEGSLGMLVHDPSIAGSLRDVFLGVRELGYVENLVRNAEKAGRDAYARAARLGEDQERELIRIRALAELGERQGLDQAPAMPGEEMRGLKGDEVQLVPVSATEGGEEKTQEIEGESERE